MIRFSLAVLCPLLLSATSSFLLPASCVGEKLIEDMILWVRSMPDAYFNTDKIEIRRMDPTDNSSPLGVFAKADIPAEEVVFQVPQKAYVQVWENKTEDDDTDEVFYHNLCLLTKKVVEEMKRGDDSEYAPYIRYLQHQSRGQIPATWSKEAKDVLRMILPVYTDGVDWIDHHFKDTGCIDPTDPFEEHVVALVKQRGFDDSLIPIWDMVNHDNGRVNTKTSSYYSEEGLKVWTSRDIRAGEELLHTYDECLDCGWLAEDWGTPEILRDFGFVEGYPHRYVFVGEQIWFEVFDEGDGKKVVHWADDEIYAEWNVGNPYPLFKSPERPGIEFLQNQIENIGNASISNETIISPYEFAMILQYRDAVIDDLSWAVKYAEFSLLSDGDEL